MSWSRINGMPGEKNTPSPHTAESRLGMRGPKLPCGWAMVDAAGVDRPSRGAFNGDAEPAGPRLCLQLQYLGGESGPQIFVDANPAPLCGGLLAAQMGCRLAGIPGAFEAEVQFDIVFGIEVRPLGIKACDIVRGHRIAVPKDLQVDRRGVRAGRPTR